MAKLTEHLRHRFTAIQEERAAIARGDPPSGFIPTRLREFDRRGGHQRKQISLYGAETGGGKSMWKYHLAWAAATSGFSVTIVDLEDSPDRTADRAFARETCINSAKITAPGELSEKEVQQIALALAEMEEWADRVELFPGVRTGEEALELFKENPGDLELFDYLSALPHGDGGREQEISNFMWGWTRHVQDDDVAGVALAQIKPEVALEGLKAYRADQANRRFAKNEDEKEAQPYIDGFRAYNTSHLAWCTDAGNNAKKQGYMFRPGRILKRLLGPKYKGKDNRMEFDFPKNNWGSEGRLTVELDLTTSRFRDLPDKGD